MKKYRHEDYSDISDKAPCIVNNDIIRTAGTQSDIANWHANPEIQLCVEGRGFIIIDGDRQSFSPGDIAVINSNRIHYTGADKYIKYHCVIIDTDFSTESGFDPAQILFSEHFRDPLISEAITSLISSYKNRSDICRIAELRLSVLKLLIRLAKQHLEDSMPTGANIRHFNEVREAIMYINNNYYRKITLDELARVVYSDKYSLSRSFKNITGSTIVNYINNYRCKAACRLIAEGESVNCAARDCGFQNLSFFTRIFKQQTGMLPSACKKTYKSDPQSNVGSV